MILTDESQMPDGLYQGVLMKNVPAKHLLERHATLALRNYNHQGNDLAIFNYVTENYQILQTEFNEYNKYRKTI